MPFLFRKNRFLLIVLLGIMGALCTVFFLKRAVPPDTQNRHSKNRQKSEVTADSVIVSQLTTTATSQLQLNPDSAITLVGRALKIQSEYGINDATVKLMGVLAACYVRKGNNSLSQMYLDTALKYMQNAHNYETVAFVYNTAAVFYQQNGQYAKSIFNYFEGLDHLKKGGGSKSLTAAKMYNNLSGLFILLQEPQYALSYLNEAKKLLNINDAAHKQTLAYVLCNSGLINMVGNQLLATKELDSALQLSQIINDNYLGTKILINLGNLSLAANNWDKAWQYLNAAQAAAKKSKTSISEVLVDFAMGNAYNLRKQYKTALPYLEAAYRKAKLMGYNDVILEISRNLQEAYARTGNYSHAYPLLNEYYKLKENSRAEEKKRTIELVLQYKAVEKDKQIAQSQLEINRQQNALKVKNIWIGMFIGGMILLLTLLAIAIIYNRNKQQLQTQELKSARQQQDIAYLTAAFQAEERERERISRDIHDGVMSTFATVKMKIKRVEKEEHLESHPGFKDILLLFERAITELRMTAHNLMPDLLLEGGLYKALFYFAGSVEEHTGIKVNCELSGQIPEEIPQVFVLFLYRAVQELVQNAIKHAQASNVIIQVINGGDILNITVEDNGKGCPSTFDEGAGLKGLRKRVALYGGKMSINTVPGHGTSVTLDFVTRFKQSIACL